MKVEIVTTGTELLLGQITNTNSAYLASELNKLGYDVLYQSTVGDNRVRMEEVIRYALDRCDIVITTGGLGPTQGDITKEVCAKIFGRELIENDHTMQRIKAHFVRVEREMAPSNTRQALIPAGAMILDNDAGTAPGVVLEHNDKILINLPGPPFEMKDMFQKKVKPFLLDKFGLSEVIVSRVLNTFGIGESKLEDEIKDLILAQSNPTLALLARPGEVIVRITAKASTQHDAEQLIGNLEQEIRRRIGDYIFAIDDESMEAVVGRMLKEHKLTIACAESCTGGLVSSRLTDIPGSSDYLIGSVVSYTNEVKQRELTVSADLLKTQGAVCEDVARAMAEGVRKKFGTSLGLGITGIAGPGGATDKKPVGLVYMAVAGAQGTKCVKEQFAGNRLAVKYRASQTVLDMARKYIKDL